MTLREKISLQDGTSEFSEDKKNTLRANIAIL